MFSRRLRRLGPLVIAAATLGALAPTASAATSFTLTTPYPAVVVSAGSRASFDLTIKSTSVGRINLKVDGAPSGWTAALHGGGLTVDAVQTNGKDDVTVRLDVDIPADATGTAALKVTATGFGETEVLPLDIRISAAGAGDVTVKTDFPALEGKAGDSFTFNLTIQNDTAEDLNYTSSGQGPDNWTVDAKPTGQSQAVTGTVKAGSSGGVAVTVKSPNDAAAGDYDINVVTTVGTHQVQTKLQVKVTGSFTLQLSTPNDVLSGHGNGGGVTEQVFTLTNTGTAPINNVKMTASAPTSWKVEFDQPTVASVAPNTPVNVTAKITPAGDAIAGDYSMTVTANGDEADANATYRFTVEASPIGWIIGIALIIAAVGGLWWVFRRYGRR